MPNESGGRVLRAELIIAALALIASACASVAAIVQSRESAIETRATLEQTRIVSKQLGSSLWPYVTFRKVIGPHSMTIGYANDGLGPALVRSFSVFEDGRPQGRLREIGSLFDANTSKRVGESDLGIGSVLRPSESITILTIEDDRFNVSRAEAGTARARFQICYCSLLGDCWSLRSEDTEPQSVHACPRQRQRVSL